MNRLWILAVLAGCTSQEERPMEDSLRVEIVSVRPENPTEGESVEIRYRIVNGTTDVILMGRGRSQYGGISEPDADTVVYNEMEQRATPPVFYSDSQILLPHGTVHETATLEVLESRVRIAPELVRFDAKAIRLYGRKKSADDSAPERRFERMDVQVYRARRTEPGARVEEPCIILGEGKPETPSAERAVSLQPRPFSLAEAQKKFGETPTSRRWSKILGGWILSSRARTAIVKSDGILELPAGSSPVLADYERDVATFVFRLSDPAKTELARMFQTREGDGMYTHGTFIDLPRAKLFEALELAREEKLAVEQVFYFFGSYYFEFRPAQ